MTENHGLHKIQVSVIIPHFNGEMILRECLQSLVATRYEHLEIIVVDNGSSDQSVLIVKNEFPRVHIIENPMNEGFAGGCNRGIEAASGEYILILNNDTVHDPEWISYLVDFLNSHPEVASVMPKIISYQHRDQFDYSGACGGQMDVYGYPFARGRIMEFIEKDQNQYDTVAPVFWSSGTAFLIRKAVLDEIGLFDTLFFAHMEEIDLHWRLHLRGYTAAVVPQAVIWHHSGWTLPPDTYRKKYLNHRNNLIMILANYSGKSLKKYFTRRILLEIISSGYALLRGDIKRFAAVYASFIWLIFHLSAIMNKRSRHQNLRKVSDDQIRESLYPGAIVFDHYIKRYKRWSELPNYPPMCESANFHF